MQNGANSLEGCLAIPLNRNLQYFTVHSTLYILAIPFLAIHPPKKYDHTGLINIFKYSHCIYSQ